MLQHLDNDTKIKYNLSSVSDLREVVFTDEADWLEKRKSTIGGSEVGIVMGLNEYTSKLQLYKNKKHEGSNSDNKYTRKGKDLEEVIFNNYVVPYFTELGFNVYKPNKIFVRESTPWLSANLDGLAVPDDERCVASHNVVAEIKWVSEYATNKWSVSEEYGNIPASYYAQVQNYMYHVDAKYAVVFAMFEETWTCETFVVNRNESFIRKMLTETEDFYKTHMLMDIPPKADVRFDSSDIARRIETEWRPEEKKSEEFDFLLSKYKALKSSEKELDSELKATLNQLIDMHLDGYVPDKVNIKFTCSSRTTRSVDAKLLKEKYPEIAEQVMKESKYTWTSVK